jgi:hypothetical protein
MELQKAPPKHSVNRAGNSVNNEFKVMRRHLTSPLSGFVVFIAGTLFGLYIVRWFVSLLPGPHIAASVTGLHEGTGNAAGCIFYMFTVTVDDPIEYVYAKVQFPTQIDNFKVGFPLEAETQDHARMQMQAFEGGRNAKGECSVVQAAISNDADVQASAAGNMIVVHASKLPSKAAIVGMVATSDQHSSLSPAPKIYTEGAYEYMALGQTVRKSLLILDGGISDAK